MGHGTTFHFARTTAEIVSKKQAFVLDILIFGENF